MSSFGNDRRNVMAAIWNTIGDSYGSGVPFLVETAEILVEQADLRPGDRVIDLGTGNGHGLIPAAKAVDPGVAVGVDISDVMLDAARGRAMALGLANIDLRNMDVTSLEFPDASFDVALASTVFQFVSYSPAALAEWHRVLVPGGRLLLSVPVPGSLVPLDGLMRDFFPRQPIEVQDAWRATGQPPGSTVLPDLAELCEQVGFVDTHVADIERSYTFPSVAEWWAFQWTHGSRAFLMTLPPDALADMEAEAARRLEPTLLPNGEVPMPGTMRVCRASK